VQRKKSKPYDLTCKMNERYRHLITN